MRNETKLTVLVIDDNSAEVQLVRKTLHLAMLSKPTPLHVNLVVANNLIKSLNLLRDTTIHAIILNLSLSDFTGLDSFKQLRQSNPRIPMIILGQETDRHQAMQLIQKGAQDFISKNDLTPNLLTKTILFAIERHRQQIEIQDRAKELEEQNIALNDFAHTVAHQIQGLLSQMVGYASLVDSHYQDQLSDPAQQAVDQIMQSGYKMNNVITELLFLASMRSESVEASLLDNKRILAEVLKRLRYQIRATEAEIKIPDSWPQAIGYAPWIEEVWLNYMSNALKYGSKDNHPPILQLGADREENGMVRFWLSDSGPGISAIDQKRLFRPHTRVTSKRIRGDGLGLSIVWRIIKKSGGEVGVNSTEGSGSCFWFTLPEGKKRAEQGKKRRNVPPNKY